jgi:hypothetical protein
METDRVLYDGFHLKMYYKLTVSGSENGRSVAGVGCTHDTLTVEGEHTTVVLDAKRTQQLNGKHESHRSHCCLQPAFLRRRDRK